MHEELAVCSEKGPVFNEADRTQLLFVAACSSVESLKKFPLINKGYLEEAFQQRAGLNQALLHGR